MILLVFSSTGTNRSLLWSKTAISHILDLSSSDSLLKRWNSLGGGGIVVRGTGEWRVE